MDRQWHLDRLDSRCRLVTIQLEFVPSGTQQVVIPFIEARRRLIEPTIAKTATAPALDLAQRPGIGQHK